MKPTDDTNSVESALGPGTRSPVPAQEPESTSRDLARSTIGKVIVEKYRVVHLLGRGGYGTVFLVETIDGTGSDRLALKVLHPHLSQSEEAKALFLNEIRVAMKVIHRYVVQIRDVGATKGGLLYYVMDYCHGVTLRHLLKDGTPLPLERTYNIIRKILRALSTAHGLGILHRDLKPANVMVLPEKGLETIRVLDFGLAAPLRETVRSTKPMGSLHYMPPEQFRRSGFGRFTDLYSVGVILYQCLTGRRPHEGKTLQEVYESILRVSPEPPQNLNPEVELYPGLAELTLKSINPHPKRRYQTAREFCLALIEVFKT